MKNNLFKKSIALLTMVLMGLVGYAQIPVTDALANTGIQLNHSVMAYGNTIANYIALVNEQRQVFEEALEDAKKTVDFIADARSLEDFIGVLNRTSCIMIDLNANWDYYAPRLKCSDYFTVEMSFQNIQRGKDFMQVVLNKRNSMSKGERMDVYDKGVENYEKGNKDLAAINEELSTKIYEEEREQDVKSDFYDFYMSNLNY